MRAYLQGYLHGQNDGYHSTLIENKMMDESYDGNLNVEYAPIDQVLEIIDGLEDELYTSSESMEFAAKFTLKTMRNRVEALRGEQE